MFMERSYGKQYFQTHVELVNAKRNLTAKDIHWAKLILPSRLVMLETGKLLPVNHYSMPLGLDIQSKSMIDLECFQNLAIIPSEIDLEPLNELKSNLKSQEDFPFYGYPRYPWRSENDYAIYKWHINAVLGQN